MLIGLKGTQVNLAAQSQAVINVNSVETIKDSQGQWIERPESMVVVFSVLNFSTAAGNATVLEALIEFGTEGTQQRVRIPIYPGLTIPVHGSFCRVTILGSTVNANSRVVAGAFIAIGAVCAQPIVALVSSQSPGQTNILAGASQSYDFNQSPDNPTSPDILPFLTGIRVGRSGPAGTTIAMGVWLRGLGGVDETWEVAAGQADEWHDFGYNGGTTNQVPLRLTITNLDPVATLEPVVYGRLSM